MPVIVAREQVAAAKRFCTLQQVTGHSIRERHGAKLATLAVHDQIMSEQRLHDVATSHHSNLSAP